MQCALPPGSVHAGESQPVELIVSIIAGPEAGQQV